MKQAKRVRMVRRKHVDGWPSISACPELQLLTRQGGIKSVAKMGVDEYIACVRSDMKAHAA